MIIVPHAFITTIGSLAGAFFVVFFYIASKKYKRALVA